MEQPIVIPVIIEECVNDMQVQDPAQIEGINLLINYQPGRVIQILDSLTVLDTSDDTHKALKYPLIAMVLPVREQRNPGMYNTVVIDRIVLATLTSSADGSDIVMDKYGVNRVFTTILYPMYYELLYRLALHPEIIGMEPKSFIHTKMDNPCQQPIGQGLPRDYVDTLEIIGLELTLNQIKTC